MELDFKYKYVGFFVYISVTLWFAIGVVSTETDTAGVLFTVSLTGDGIRGVVGSICAFNCQFVWGTLEYRGLFSVNGIYLYLIICCKNRKKYLAKLKIIENTLSV